MKGEPQIYCPRCKYRPVAEDRWSCVPTCGTVWHTFWTGGVCPGCGHRWRDTQCPSCHAISPHRKWYHNPKGKVTKERKRELEPAGA